MITATGGTIGGLTIEEWSEVGYRVEITSSDGIIIKMKKDSSDRVVTLTAHLYKGATEIISNHVYEVV
jgi:hypothetical protein